MAVKKRELIDRLAVICAHAEALGGGAGVAPGVTGNALMREFSSLKHEVFDQADQLLDELERLERELESQNTVSPELLVARSSAYLEQMEEWKARRPEMPREIVAFILRKRIKCLRTFCRERRERQRYQELTREDAQCDCVARARSGYLSKPHNSLRLVDSIGTPFLRLCLTWKCTVCGAIWIQEEHHDRGTTLSKWSLGSLIDAS